MNDFPEDGNALTDPPVYLDWRNYQAMFVAMEDREVGLNEKHLTNYQALILKLRNTYEANKASAHANAELITKLRKKIKKVKRALK